MKENPEYELKLVDRTLKTNDDQIINEIQENLLITYKYYEIAFNNEKINSVNTIEEAEELIKRFLVSNLFTFHCIGFIPTRRSSDLMKKN